MSASVDDTDENDDTDDTDDKRGEDNRHDNPDKNPENPEKPEKPVREDSGSDARRAQPAEPPRSPKHPQPRPAEHPHPQPAGPRPSPPRSEAPAGYRRRRPTGLHPPAAGEPAGAAPGTVLDTIKVAVVMLDTTGRILLWSPLAEEMLGWAGEDIVGRRLGTLMEHPGGPRRADAAPPPGPAEDILAELLRHGRWNGILSLRHRDGHSVQVEARASLLVDGDGRPFVLASAAETSRLRTLEHDLAALDALFDSSPLGVAIFDPQLRYVRVNEALARMNRKPVAEHLGRIVTEIVPGPSGDELLALQRYVLATGRPVIDILVPDHPGAAAAGPVWSVSYHRLEDRAGHVLGISCTIMDVTERQQSLREIERAGQRLALLNDVGSAIADLLDVRRISQAIAQTVVPGFCDFSGVILHAAVDDGGQLPGGPYPESTEMRQLGVGAVRRGADVDRMIGTEETVPVSRYSLLGQVLHTGKPRLLETAEQLREITYPGDPRIRAALDLGVQSLLAVPLRARGVVLGVLVVARLAKREPFDRDDLTLAVELADRAGASLDNARLYMREREGALMLQRGLLPQHVPHPPGVEIAYRYVPGSSGAEAGGDWFDVIPLADGRVALVVGDVMGHSLRAAATMGRMRTAVRTLAGLDMPPHELLRRVDELGEDLAHSPVEGWLATCVYAVYDPATRRVSVARAGHPPPVLVDPARPDGQPGSARQLDVPPGLPLGVGGADFQTVEVDVPDGAVLVLYTDGLVENRDEDVTEGMARVRAVLQRPMDSLEDACDDLLAAMVRGGEPDDVALLMARLGALPTGSSVSWTFEAQPGAVREARRGVRETLRAWGLDAVTDTTVLLVSELVTNSLRYAHGPIGVRMVRGGSLLVEVSDPLPDPPRRRAAAEEDEGGRGLQLVAQASRRWGTRHGPLGKTVWFELAVS